MKSSQALNHVSMEYISSIWSWLITLTTMMEMQMSEMLNINFMLTHLITQEDFLHAVAVIASDQSFVL